MLSSIVAEFKVPFDERKEYKQELGRRLRTLAQPALKRAQEERAHWKAEEEKEARVLFAKLDAVLAEFVGADTIAAINAAEARKKARRRTLVQS